jgi:hypothetical protein
MRFVGILWLFLIAVVLSAEPDVMAQDLKVLVLDALDGKPQANVEVDYFCTGLPRKTQPNQAVTSPYRVITNSGGLALFANPCGDEEKIELWISPPGRKEQCGELPPLAFRDVTSVGIVSEPDAEGGINGGLWCPTKVSKKLKPVPGQVTMFVKKPTWWQSHVAG